MKKSSPTKTSSFSVTSRESSSSEPPNFFDRTKFGKEVLTFPDRVRLTIDAVKAGKGLMLLGGWYSFTDEQGKGG